MATTKSTKTTQNKTSKSGTTRKTSGSGSSRSGSGRKSKNSSDDTLKFLLVLIIAGIAIALIFFSQDKKEQTGNVLTGTPTPTIAAATQVVQPTKAPDPTRAQEQDTPVHTPTGAPTAAPTSTPLPTATGTPVPTATPSPTPTPALSAAEAEDIVRSKVDTSVYSIQLVSETLRVGNGSYYQFGVIANQEFVYPFLVVDKAAGTLSCYDSTAETVFDFTIFPVRRAATPTPAPTKAPEGRKTAEEAYQILCTYSKESLHIAKAVSEYEAEYGSELTLIDGVDCYRINLSEFSNGKVRNRGEFYVSVDGTKCFYIDSDTNEFIEAVK